MKVEAHELEVLLFLMVVVLDFVEINGFVSLCPNTVEAIEVVDNLFGLD